MIKNESFSITVWMPFFAVTYYTEQIMINSFCNMLVYNSDYHK